MARGGPEGGDAAPAAGPSPALQVIVLGSGGGPLEANTTAFLVRSLASGWRKGSIVAVDAGVHLSAIARILQETQPPDLGKTEALSLPHTLESGPFRGLEVHSGSAAVNAAYIHGNLIDTYLITHPHLDHIAGFVINTAGILGSRPKRLAGLPSTIDAFKNHIFNNVIWPNLSDENNGAGLVTYMRLVEGGSPALGDGDGRGYLELSDGLAVKIWGVSHGHCIERHPHRGSGSTSGYGSFDASGGAGPGPGGGPGAPAFFPHHHSSSASPGVPPYLQQPPPPQQHGVPPRERASSVVPGSSAPSGGAAGGHRLSMASVGMSSPSEGVCVYDSSAYFVRDVATGREVLIFGDVEPDSVSLSPRNRPVWREAAPKIAAGKLAAVLVECSYDNSQGVDRLFGHLAPRFLVEELAALAREVEAARAAAAASAAAAAAAATALDGRDARKRKRSLGGGGAAAGADEGAQARRRTSALPHQRQQQHVVVPPAAAAAADDPVSPRTTRPSPHIATPTAELSLGHSGRSSPSPDPPAAAGAEAAGGGGGGGGGGPLAGLKVVVIHVKDRLTGGEPAGEAILRELREEGEAEGLGCEFIISRSGQEFYF